MVIVQPFFGSVKEYIEAFLSQGCPFSVPDRCPHPDCQAAGSLIRWGTYERGALTGEADFPGVHEGTAQNWPLGNPALAIFT